MSKTSAVAVKASNTAVALATEFEEFAGVGMEEVGSEDLAVPFLRILAQLSPQVNKRDGAYVQGAEAGMVFNTVLNEAYSGEEGILVVPCFYNRRYVEWKPRAAGGGLVASYEANDPIKDTTQKNDRGEDVLPNGNLLSNTAQFFVLLLHPTQGPQRCLITMTSTQLKKAKAWNMNLNSYTAMGKNGLYTLPMASHVYRLRTVPERNDKGDWFGWLISRERALDIQTEGHIFRMGIEFAKSVRAGEVKVKEDVDHHDAAPSVKNDVM